MSKQLQESVAPATAQQDITEQAMAEQQAEYEAMAQQSMTALRSQEELEQEAYLNGDTQALYSTDSYQYQDDNMPQNSNVFYQGETGAFDEEAMNAATEQLEPEVDPMVTEQQAESENTNKFADVCANLFQKLANIFGEDTAIGEKLQEVADNIRGNYAEDARKVQEEALQAQSGADTATNTDSNATTEAASDEYVPTAEERLQRKEAEDYSNQNMRENAQLVARNDEFLDMADATSKDFSHMDNGMVVMGERLQEDTMARLAPVDAGAKEKSECANNYMTMMRGIKTYNDTALDEISERYKDDPEKLETAKQGLGNLMTRATGNAYAMIGGDNKQWDFLSEKDVQELDSMKLQGVDMTYSEYVKDRGLQLESEKDDMSMYANAEDTVSKQTEEPVALGSHSGGSFGVESRTDMKGTMTKSVSNSGVDRGQQAENVFSTVLQNEAQSKQESFTAGLER